MPGRMSLAEQLASIRDDAPVEFDPEAVDYSTSNPTVKDLDAGRADYLEVGTSQLRKNLDNELGGQYAGKKASRQELYGGADHSGSHVNGQGDNSEDEDSGDDYDSDERSESGAEEEEEIEHDDDDDDEEEEGQAGASFEVDHEEDEEDSGSGDDDEEIPSDVDESNEAGPSQPPQKSKTSNAATEIKTRESGSSKLDKNSRNMLQELKKASSADVEKGRDVRKQLSFWDTLLEARIRLQKCISSVNVLPAPDQLGDYSLQSGDELTRTKASLEELSELLFSIRQTLHENNDKIDLSSAVNKKRKRGSPDYTDSAMDAVTAIAQLTNSHEHNTISKWSDKVSSASTSLGAQNKFKVLGPQNTLRQIETILSQDMDRLVQRSRIRRGAGGKAIKVIGRDGAHAPVDGEKDVSGEVYDDTDFYQALLRDIVDMGHGAANGAGVGGVGSSYSNFNNTSKKKAAGVDPKASKGRKLRYHVHEKLQNFMAPIPMLTWEKEQIDELFRGLLGGFGRDRMPSETVDLHAVAESASGQSDGGENVGQFRIF